MRTSEKSAIRAVAEYLRAADPGQMHLAGTGAVRELEKKLSQFYGLPYALCVSSGSSALLAVALALGLKRQEFLTTPYTYGASLSPWLLLGNRPVFCDIDGRTLCLDADSARKVLSSRTKALLAVDVYGVPSDTKALRRLADEHGIWYVADAAQSLGATAHGRPASILADAIIVSFTSGKTVFAGEGGAVLTPHAELYQRMIWFTQHPHRQRRELGLHLDNELAINARIHPLAAVWANGAWHESFHRLSNYQKRCLELTQKLDNSGLTEPLEYKRRGDLPSFFRLTVAWRDRPETSALAHALGKEHAAWTACEAPVRLINRQTGYLAQWGATWRSVPLKEAERQILKRFAMVPKSMPCETRP